MPRPNQRLTQPRPEGGFALRVYQQKARGKHMPRLLIKCGCCEQKVEIHYDPDCLEINGVMASVENWREILLPLLCPSQQPPIGNAATDLPGTAEHQDA